MHIAHASASEVGKVSTPGGLPFRGSPGAGSTGGRQVVATVLINLGKIACVAFEREGKESFRRERNARGAQGGREAFFRMLRWIQFESQQSVLNFSQTSIACKLRRSARFLQQTT